MGRIRQAAAAKADKALTALDARHSSEDGEYADLSGPVTGAVATGLAMVASLGAARDGEEQ